MTQSERLERLEKGPFWELLGLKIISAENGTARLSLEIKKKHLQLYGIVHGGALATIIDGAIGAAVQSSLHEDEASTTIDLQVMYDKAAKNGTLTAKANLIRRGKTIIFGECQIEDGTGQLIAHGNATYMVLQHSRWSKANPNE